jgi:DNA/RNA-binding domain of Phe-tRNA-synthetase-like protein
VLIARTPDDAHGGVNSLLVARSRARNHALFTRARTRYVDTTERQDISMQLSLHDAPRLCVRVFTCHFAAELESLQHPRIGELLASETCTELAAPDDAMRAAIRDVLRQRGFKPTGRSKPSSEYLLRTRREGGVRSINLAVDAGNAISLHSGLPISVVDLDRLTPPLSIRSAAQGEQYVFNPTGQVIDLGGLPCLYDQAGPCANAVKDAQRTKTEGATRATLTIIWSSDELQARTEQALQLYRTLLRDAGATLAAVAVVAEP